MLVHQRVDQLVILQANQGNRKALQAYLLLDMAICQGSYLSTMEVRKEIRGSEYISSVETGASASHLRELQ